MRLMETVSLALVGIGAIEPSRLLGASGNVFSSEELEVLRAHGAVGDICLRFFDRQGKPVVTPLNGRVIGMELAQLRRASCVVGVAGDRRDSRRALGLPDQRPDHRSQHRPEAGRRRPRQRNRGAPPPPARQGRPAPLRDRSKTTSHPPTWRRVSLCRVPIPRDAFWSTPGKRPDESGRGRHECLRHIADAFFFQEPSAFPGPYVSVTGTSRERCPRNAVSDQDSACGANNCPST